MDSDEDAMDMFIALYAIKLIKQKRNAKKRNKRLFKTRPINRSRKQVGFYHVYFVKMKEVDPQQFFKYTRMTVQQFDKLLNWLTPILTKKELPDTISVEARLAITLHFLSQGSSMQSIAWSYHVGETTVHVIIIETCEAIWNVLHKKYLKAPDTTDEWLNIARDFYNLWNFPNCIGALDGKHINIQAPAKSGSLYFNYKKTFSIVLLASCDAKYMFNLVDVGAYGSQSDGGIFKHSIFGNMLEERLLNVPEPTQVPNSNHIQPFALVADEAFPLKEYIMRPYPGRNLPNNKRIFNYRLSRARRCIENAFGILANRWRLLRTTIVAKETNVETFVKATLVLHNYIMYESILSGDSFYCPPGFDDDDSHPGSWRNDGQHLKSVGRLSSNRSSRNMNTVRDNLMDYFSSPEGEVEWQQDKI